MKLILAMVLTAAISACATQHRPPYSSVTELSPDCANGAAHIKYLTQLKQLPTLHQDNRYLYDRTIEIQIDRLTYYCQ